MTHAPRSPRTKAPTTAATAQAAAEAPDTRRGAVPQHTDALDVAAHEVDYTEASRKERETMNLLPTLTPTHSGSCPAVGRVYHCDWLSLVSALPAQSVDAYILDLPYGTTACSWDEIIPFEPMWREVKRTLKPRGVFVTTASQPFTSKLVMSNLEMFKYSWVWVKSRAVDFINANYRPMKKHEDVIVFSQAAAAPGAKSIMNYWPQGMSHSPVTRVRSKGMGIGRDRESQLGIYISNGEHYPTSILEFSSEVDTLHPTQKPVALYEYLIRTYTQPGELVVDFCMGSGTTCVAARNLKRAFIGCDTDAGYVAIARERLRQPYEQHYITRESAPMDELPLFAANATA